MAHIIATVHAYDCMDQVQVSVQARDIDEDIHEGDPPYVLVTTFPGTGEDDPRQWLRDLLVGILERL